MCSLKGLTGKIFPVYAQTPNATCHKPRKYLHHTRVPNCYPLVILRVDILHLSRPRYTSQWHCARPERTYRSVQVADNDRNNIEDKQTNKTEAPRVLFGIRVPRFGRSTFERACWAKMSPVVDASSINKCGFPHIWWTRIGLRHKLYRSGGMGCFGRLYPSHRSRKFGSVLVSPPRSSLPKLVILHHRRRIFCTTKEQEFIPNRTVQAARNLKTACPNFLLPQNGRLNRTSLVKTVKVPEVPVPITHRTSVQEVRPRWRPWSPSRCLSLILPFLRWLDLPHWPWHMLRKSHSALGPDRVPSMRTRIWVPQSRNWQGRRRNEAFFPSISLPHMVQTSGYVRVT